MSILQWQQSKYAGYEGDLLVGEKKIRVATISWSVKRGDTEPWHLRTAIPGFSTQTWKFETTEEAQAKADRLIETFARFVAAAKETTS